MVAYYRRPGAVPRKSEQELRSHTLYVRLNDKELSHLDSLCERTGLSRSEVVRSSMQKSIPIREKHHDDDLLYMAWNFLKHEFSRQGNNLNQIAHKLNSDDVSAKDDIAAIRANNEEIVEMFRSMFNATDPEYEPSVFSEDDDYGDE